MCQNEPEIYILLCDVESGRTVMYYGRKDAEVKLISRRGDVLIVEDTTGSRYPVRAEKVVKKEVF